MRSSNWTPSIVPNDHDDTAYLVADDSAELAAHGVKQITKRRISKPSSGICWAASTATLPVVAFNTAERWSEDVSEDVARELRRPCDLQMRELPSSITDFVERHEALDRRQLTLRLLRSTRFS